MPGLMKLLTVGCGAGKEVADVESGWRPYPGAIEPHQNLPRVEPGRVVGMGAICDLRPQLVADARSQSFSVSEFVTLENGRRVTLHRDPGSRMVPDPVPIRPLVIVGPAVPSVMTSGHVVACLRRARSDAWIVEQLSGLVRW